jgi:broad specificity phosphatase PhoE
VAARIVLIRHAATETGGRLCGTFDLPLSASGRVQVNALLERGPAHDRPDALLASPLARARQVAEALGPIWGLTPSPAEWAREIHCGDVEGLPLVDL